MKPRSKNIFKINADCNWKIKFSHEANCQSKSNYKTVLNLCGLQLLSANHQLTRYIKLRLSTKTSIYEFYVIKYAFQLDIVDFMEKHEHYILEAGHIIYS